MLCAYFAAPSLAYRKRLHRAYFVEPSTHAKPVTLSIFRLPSMHVENGCSFIFRCAEHMIIKNGCSVRTSMHRACISKTIAPCIFCWAEHAYKKRMLCAYHEAPSMYKSVTLCILSFTEHVYILKGCFVHTSMCINARVYLHVRVSYTRQNKKRNTYN